MRNRLLRGLAASILAFAVILPATAQPAHAVDGAATKLLDTVFALARLMSGHGTSADVKVLLAVAIGAVTESNREVIERIDATQAAPVRAAARSASNEFSDFEQIVDDELGLELWTHETGRGASLGADLLGEVGRPTADQIGHAVHQLYQLARVGAEFRGSRNLLMRLTRDYIEASREMIEKLEPDCGWVHTQTMPGGYQRYYRCVGANGVDEVMRFEQYLWGTYHAGPVDTDAVKVESAMNSSWVVAKEYLPYLEQELREMEQG